MVLRHPVDQHHGQAGARRFGEQRVAEVRGGEHDPVRVAGAHLLEDQPFPLPVPVGVADQRHVAGRREPVLRSPRTMGGNKGFVRSGMITPTVSDRRVRRLRATGLGW